MLGWIFGIFVSLLPQRWRARGLRGGGLDLTRGAFISRRWGVV